MSDSEPNNKRVNEVSTVDADDLSIEPDIEEENDPSQPYVAQIGPELYLYLDDISVIGDAETDPLTGESPWRIHRRISPEVVAGICVGLLVALFATVAYFELGSDDADGSSETDGTTPAVEVEVEVGKGIVLERE